MCHRVSPERPGSRAGPRSYAHQARSIVNEASVNEDPNIQLIRALRAEIEALRSQYGDAKGHVALAEVQALRSKLSSSERLMADMNRTWEDKLRESERMRLENARILEEQGVMAQAAQQMMDNRHPNLVNLNEDPQLSEMLVYNIKARRSFFFLFFSFFSAFLSFFLS